MSNNTCDTAPVWSIGVDDLRREQVRALLALHLHGMQANTPDVHVHALDASGLLRPEVTLWTIWRGEQLAGMAALQALGEGRGELKSMRTHPDFLRQGVAARLLEHVIEHARCAGMHTISLETGCGESFEPALALYRKRGFVDGPAFAHYSASAFNQFLHLSL